MPLRDHFRPPISNRHSWQGFHGGWPMAIVQKLAPLLPERYTAEPRVNLGSYCEIDVSTYEHDSPKARGRTSRKQRAGSVATAPQPTLVADVELNDQYEYRVLVFDQKRGRQLVAEVEIVSPANKDRRKHRQALVSKCAGLLQRGVCVSIIDLVTARRFNLYTELLTELGCTDPAFSPKPPPIYAVTCRRRASDETTQLESWAYRLTVGKPLPKLPIWLDEGFSISLDVEASYEETCRTLRITSA